MEIYSLLLGLSLWATPLASEAHIVDNALIAPKILPSEASISPVVSTEMASGTSHHTEKDQLMQFAEETALNKGISTEELIATISCESGWNPDAIGDNGNSRGLAQIHKPSHPTITDEQAFNPHWAIEWTAEKFKEGKEHMWTCWRNQFAQ